MGEKSMSRQKTSKEILQEEIEERQQRIAEIEAKQQQPVFRVIIKAEVRWVDHIKADTREEAEEIARDKFDLPQSEIGDGSDMEITGITSIEILETDPASWAEHVEYNGGIL
jgi:hypothetical protein